MLELRQLIYLSFPKILIKTTIHDIALEKMTHEMLKKINKAYEDGWSCDGKKICGCRGGKVDFTNNEPEEFRYHCVECSFDYCEQCYEYYGNDHEHELTKYTHTEISNLHNGAYLTWGCDGRRNKSKCPQGEDRSNLDVIYHDDKNFFDLCEKCCFMFKEE